MKLEKRNNDLILDADVLANELIENKDFNDIFSNTEILKILEIVVETQYTIIHNTNAKRFLIENDFESEKFETVKKKYIWFEITSGLILGSLILSGMYLLKVLSIL